MRRLFCFITYVMTCICVQFYFQIFAFIPDVQLKIDTPEPPVFFIQHLKGSYTINHGLKSVGVLCKSSCIKINSPSSLSFYKNSFSLCLKI
jgi:hypothetical protein